MKTYHNWEQVKADANVITEDDNFIHVFIDGVGWASHAKNANNWALLRIGNRTFSGILFTEEWYEEMKYYRMEVDKIWL